MTKTNRSNGDVFNSPFDAADIDILVNPKRIFDQEEHTTEDVAHEGLGAEPNGYTTDAEAGDQRCDRESQELRGKNNDVGGGDDAQKIREKR